MSDDASDHHSRIRRRFDRQFAYIARLAPTLRHPILTIRTRGWWIVRLPLAIAFILGGFLAFLPVLGVWMLPLGLLLLAVDLPILRGPTASFMIRTRRRVTIWMRWWRRRK